MSRPDPPLPLVWRTERMFLSHSGSIERVAGAWRILSPDNPTYWWGNVLVMDKPPMRGDLGRWQRQFRDLIQMHQPLSAHMTFTWQGSDPGEVEPFRAAGFVLSKSLTMRASHPMPVAAQTAAVTLRAFGKADWPQLLALHVENASADQPRDRFCAFMQRSIANWRRIADADLGNWFGAFDGDTLVAGLGIFVEPPTPAHRDRLARFQYVTTDARWRRQGICSALAAEAARQTAIRHAPSEFVIQANADEAARHIYQKLGFQYDSTAFGLERGRYPTGSAP